ncbi:hypothetical protein [Nocardia miyunensis]|uniref:hypothetical protein n=1 Tax=Nocardia miyunensis TaxID=282684 RepID=UPI000AF76C5C|nr:hypothetical protein [Nocardia miyunensis]
MTRYAHFVGSVPKELMTGDGAVLRWFADSSGEHPTGLPCDLDPDWIMQYLRDRAEHDDVLEVVRAGEYADYSDFPSYGLRRGAKLEPRHMSMGRLERIGSVVAAFDELRAARPELARTKLQLSQPNPLDLAMFVFAGAAVSAGFPLGPALRRSNVIVAALRALPVVTEAVLEEIAAVNERYGDRVVWQVESPFALLGMVKADQLGAKWAAAPLLSRQLAGLLTRIHDVGAHSVVHLCYGDYQHKSLLSPRSLAPAVTLLNHTVQHLLAQGTPLPAVHIPCAFGSEPAPLDPEFYAPLRRLDPEWKIIAGVVSPGSDADSTHALRLFEEAAGRTAYGVATACGLGRCNVAEAEQAASTMAKLTAETIAG